MPRGLTGRRTCPVCHKSVTLITRTRTASPTHHSDHTLTSYHGYLRKHIAPLIGHFRIAAVTAEILDGFYAELARCRDHCATPAHAAAVTKRTMSTMAGPLGKKEKRHVCRPLSSNTIRKNHFLITARLPIRHTLALDHHQPRRPGQSTA
jgi:hypothetical protein